MKFKGFSFAEVMCVMIILSVLSLLFWNIVYPIYSKRVAASKIKKFQSTIQQIRLKAQKDYSDWHDYFLSPDLYTESQFMNDYVLPYVTYLEKDTDDDGNLHVFLADATSFSIKKASCMTFILDINGNMPPNEPGKDLFYFNYCPSTDSSFVRQGDFIPYQTKEMNDRASALEKCKENPQFCSGFISYDNYEFSDDYPFKIPL